MPLYRIRRMGSQFATTGIGVMPPDELRHEEGIFERCSKLVPGQVIDLPASHDLAVHKLIEQVSGPEDDEIVRPWVFESAEQALLSDPNRTHLTLDQIRDGIELTHGATHNRRTEATDRGAPIKSTTRIPRHIAPVEDDENAARSQNRVSRDIKDELTPVDEDGEAPAPRMSEVRQARRPRGRQ
jgi:hypothetical protein